MSMTQTHELRSVLWTARARQAELEPTHAKNIACTLHRDSSWTISKNQSCHLNTRTRWEHRAQRTTSYWSQHAVKSLSLTSGHRLLCTRRDYNEYMRRMKKREVACCWWVSFKAWLRSLKCYDAGSRRTGTAVNEIADENSAHGLYAKMNEGERSQEGWRSNLRTS